MGKGGNLEKVKAGTLGTQLCAVAGGLFLFLHLISFAIWPTWTSLADSGVADKCEDMGGSEVMKGTWAEVSSVRFGAVSGIEGRSCCSSGVMSGTRPDPLPLDADGAVDYDICVHPSDARNDFNGCTGDEGAETTCCALPTGRVTCEDGFTAIMEAYDDTSATTQAATGCKDGTAGDATRVQWHCCSCALAFEVYTTDNPDAFAGNGCRPSSGCKYSPQFRGEESANIMNLLAALLMCFLGFMTSVQHKKIFGIFFLVFSVMWTVGGFLAYLFLTEMGDHCETKLNWSELTDAEKTGWGTPWCDDVAGMAVLSIVSMLISVFGVVAGAMAAFCSNDLYASEEASLSGTGGMER